MPLGDSLPVSSGSVEGWEPATWTLYPTAVKHTATPPMPSNLSSIGARLLSRCGDSDRLLTADTGRRCRRIPATTRTHSKHTIPTYSSQYVYTINTQNHIANVVHDCVTRQIPATPHCRIHHF